MNRLLDFLLHRGGDHADVRRVARLPLVGRLADRKTRRHAAAMATGAGLCALGSFMATNPVAFVPHVIWDAVSYSIHGAGLMPLLTHVEPLWRLVAGDVEAVA